MLKQTSYPFFSFFLLAWFPFSAYAFTASSGKQIELSGSYATSGGEATYSIPIHIPNGRKDLTPKLSLDYRSDSPNGHFGLGWSLSEQSSITRCGQNLEKDKKWGGVNFNTNDRYCLDGQRLIAISGKAGANLTEYRLEQNGYQKIVSYGQTGGNGPAYFKIWKTDGSIYQYGNTSDSRVELPNQSLVYKWSLNQIADSSNNTINYKYEENKTNGTHRLSTIAYVGGKVLFNYQDRTDKISQYLFGSKLQRTARINQVVIYDSQGTTIGRYNLRYQSSSTTQRSQIQSIEYCSANNNCSTPIQFSWNNSSIYRSQRTTKSLDFADVRFFDHDRNGSLSAYGTKPCTYEQGCPFQVISPFGGNGQKTASKQGFALVNSLNSPSIAIQSYSYKTVCKTVSAGQRHDRTVCSEQLQGNKLPYSYMPNADGNLVKFEGEKFAADLNGDGKQTLSSYPGGTNQPTLGVFDIDNDGKDDYYSQSGDKLIFYLSSKNHAPYTLDTNLSSIKKIAFGDINNDGYLDFVLLNSNTFYIYLFNGKQFIRTASYQTNSTIISPEKIALIDNNADGYPELYYNNKFYLNHFGNISFTSYVDQLNDVTQSEDVNSDGFPDYVQSKDNKLSLVTSKPYAQDKINKIEEHNVEYRLTYKPASDTSVHRQIAYYQYPIVNSTPTRYLISDVVKSPKGYASTTYNYYYEGAKSHLAGGGFLGFLRISETESGAIETKTVTEFEQLSLPLAGKIKSTKVYKNKKLVSENSYTYQVNTKTGAHAKYYQVYAKAVTKKQYGLNNNTIERQEVTNRTVNTFGQVTKETTTLSSNLSNTGNYTTQTINSYLANGITNNHVIYNIDTTSGISNFNTLVNTYEAGLTRYCAANGDIYFKPNDLIVLISGEIDTPIVVQKYNQYFKYQQSSSTTNASDVTSKQGSIVSTTATTFNNANPQSCGHYVQGDFNQDGKIEFSTESKNITQLVTESGDNFWKLGALTKSTSSITDTLNNRSKSTTDTFSYNSQGLVIAQTTKSSSYESDANISDGGKWLTRNYRYDSKGNVTEEALSGSDLPTRKTTITYDSQSLYPTSSQNALGHRTQFTYDDQGRLIKTISPLKNRTTTYHYDEFGRQISETNPGLNNTTKQVYKLSAACPNAISSTTSCEIIKLPAGGQVITHFDYAGREVRKLHTAFNGKLVTVDTLWDRNGRKIQVTRPQFITNTKPAPKVTFKYDDLDREIEKSEPAANGSRAVFKTNYSGLKTTIVDARGFSHSTQSNLLGHILRKDEPLGAYQLYSYYPDGKLRSSTDSKGNITQIRYDNLGYRTYLDDPDMGKWQYTYNAAGELIYKKDANNNVTTISYDALGRKTKQIENGQQSTWRYDERGAIGTLSGFSGNGSQTDYFYNESGLNEEIAVTIGNEKFSTHYFYDGFERVAREVRPNGIDNTLIGTANRISNKNNPTDRLAVEYIYNPNGYMSAVRSPKTYADDMFTSASFREDIRQLLQQAITQANQYLQKAEKYATQQSFFTNKANEYNKKTVNVNNLDSSSAALLGNGYRYKQWCNNQGECYLRPATWVILHDDVSIPLDITLDGAIYRLNKALSNSSKTGVRNYNTTLHSVSKTEFDSQSLTPSTDLVLADYDKNGQQDLVSTSEVYAAKADGQTREELLFAADDLSEAANIAGSYYRLYTDLANQLINLSEKVAELSGLYCEASAQLGGTFVDDSQRKKCADSNQTSQADHLNLILTQSELEDSTNNPAYIYYWQRRDTDAYDHTLSETLGNGLVNTYNHNPNTGRPDYISTHRANTLVNPKLSATVSSERNIRQLYYRYDNHNNVVYREDDQLGITDQWQYDGLDRVTRNSISLVDRARHGLNNPDLQSTYEYRYDNLGNITFKTGIGNYHYTNNGAGPHAVTSANGLIYTYDSNGNMLSAKATNATNNTAERTLTWTAFNKPSKITRNGKTVEFFYDANHNRYKKKSSDGKETVYLGKYYERVKNTVTGEVQNQHFVFADGKLIALNTQTQDADNKLKDKQIRYLHYDALNSVDMVTDGYGLIVERRSYDTWGKQRKVTWQDNDPLAVAQAAITNRGYTGHEEITEIGLIHMNGRVYDQELARFISPDPHIQSPFLTNSFNRYTYAMNNPLKYNDPTGFFWGENAGTCNVDGSNRDLKGNKTGRWDNGNNKDAQKKNSTSNSEQLNSSQQKNRVIDDKEYADLKGGQFVADDNQNLNTSGPIQGKYRTIEQDESVEQSLNSDLKKAKQGELPSTVVTDTVGVISEALAPKPLKPAVAAINLAIASTEDVPVERVGYTGVTYKVMEREAIQFSDGTTYTRGPKIDTGRRVTHLFKTNAKRSKINVRDFERRNIDPTIPSQVHYKF
ncbi:RHS repeat-associated core domain-containing protein [Vibrio gangliei]|uniref:RHS repeat-associated core domain-containing protein n=1 Tax=Vibrio gangliei TaxID=2077090 RepID=UPI000D021D0D|nr:RHS repeat-associated core domain-containing protein [Vibrio gangliei]